VLFRKFHKKDSAERIPNKPLYPGHQDSCMNQENNPSEAYPASRKIRKSAAFTALPGSLTIEAALVMPIVIVVLTALMSLIAMMGTELKLQQAMEVTGGRLAGYMCAAEALTAEEKNTLLREVSEDIVLTSISAELVREEITEELGGSFSDNTLIRGGLEGISFLGTRFDPGTQNITICATYDLQVPFFSILGASIRISQRTVRRAWTGKVSEGSGAEEIVYITETGRVYHTSLSCSHLKLSISSVSRGSIEGRRNTDGAKYYPCELCGEEEASTVFITSYGDRYHTNRNCSGLKRTIKSIPISQVGSRTLCKTCKRRKK